MKKINKFQSVLLSIIFIFAVIMPSKAFADVDEGWEWSRYAGNTDNNSVTDTKTIRNIKEADTLWTMKAGTGWESSPTPPLISDKYLYTAVDNRMLKISKETGEILAKSPSRFKGNVGYATNPCLYADGKFFVPLNNGRIQSVDGETLEPLWVKGVNFGQTMSNIGYLAKNGKKYVYTGTWTGEESDGIFFALDAETGQLVWQFTPSEDGKVSGGQTENKKRGFYWSGPYVTDKFLAVGTDNGSDSIEELGATLYTLDPETGKVIDHIGRIAGDIRTSISYKDGYLFFATKKGQLHKVKVSESGKLSDHSSFDLGGMATATPVIHNDRIYIGVCGSSQFDSSAGHYFSVIKNDNKLSQESFIYKQPVPGYPQATPLLTTGYSSEGKVYVYFTYNAYPGGIYYFCDKEGLTKPLKSAEDCLLYIPDKEKQQYCISPIIADSNGTLYYKNDSCNIFAIARNPAYLENLTITGNGKNAVTDENIDFSKVFKTGIKEYKVKAGKNSNLYITPEPCKGGKVYVNNQFWQGDPVNVALSSTENTEIKIMVEKTEDKKIYRRTYTIWADRAASKVEVKDFCLTECNNIIPWTGEGNSPLEMTPNFDKSAWKYGFVANDTVKDEKAVNLWIKTENSKTRIKVKKGENCSNKNFDVDEDSFKIVEAGPGLWRTTIYGDYDNDLEYDMFSALVNVTSEDGTKSKTMKAEVWLDKEKDELKSLYEDQSGEPDSEQIKGQWKKHAGKWWYKYSDGSYVKNNWEKIDNKWYYFDSSGYSVTGWQKIKGYWYFFGSCGDMKTGWQKYKSHWYWFRSNGSMKSEGWQKVDNHWYFFGSNGQMKTGWQKISGHWYYFDDSGYSVTGWRKIGRRWYHFGNYGITNTYL